MKLLKKYDKACLEIAKEFWNKYFKEDEEDTFESNYKRDYIYPIGGQLDGIWQVNDYFFNLSDMVVALRHEATWEQLSEWYDGMVYKKKRQNLISFLKFNWIKWNNIREWTDLDGKATCIKALNAKNKRIKEQSTNTHLNVIESHKIC